MSRSEMVSVIIPFLNAECFIQEAIESVFAQTYEKWELLLVDDGSTDRSTSIAQRYSQQHPNQVRYLEHDGHRNQGLSAARNLGIFHSRGDYLAFLDADDIWLPHKLEQQVAILEAHPQAGMLYGLSQWWYSWTGKLEDSQRDFVHDLGLAENVLVRPPALLAPFFITQEAVVPNICNILIRRATVEQVGGFENSFRDVYEDQVFIAKICVSTPVFVSSECWDYYRQHPDSISSLAKKKGQEVQARLFFLNWLADYLSGQGFPDSEILRGLRQEIRAYHHPVLQALLKSKRLFVERAKALFLWVARRTIPAPLRSWLWALRWRQAYIPPVGWVRLGDLRRLIPISREFGYDRGCPVDRYYIEKFLGEQRMDVRGFVLEIADDNYTRQFGGERVRKSDILHVAPGNPKATIIGDLVNADHIPSDTFDCIILTQTLQVIYNLPAVVCTLYRILKPSGVALITAPGISQISRYDMDRWGYYWSFTSLSLRKLFEEVFPSDHILTRSYGNVLAATAFLYGMATQDLKEEQLEFTDPDYELIIGLRVMKPAAIE